MHIATIKSKWSLNKSLMLTPWVTSCKWISPASLKLTCQLTPDMRKWTNRMKPMRMEPRATNNMLYLASFHCANIEGLRGEIERLGVSVILLM